ncbi:Homeodomain-like protein [Mycotypha africana]|uniref:Homeodomain-like protein n=1 Tax=Mycotypha africana TaxID=64632 RepID=UPI002300047E|nr:Homeodomain-like protein [Mycotypha africana]KAI8973675.1 Homeodomain-like protein [Mycotypha africana]
MMSPSISIAEKRRYSVGGGHYDLYPPQHPQLQHQRWGASYLMSPIITTTRTHSVKRNKRPASYSRWTIEEDELLRQAVQLHGPHKWSLIASHVPNRTPMQCSTRWLGALNPNIHKGRWTENEDAVLRYSVMEYANMTDSEGRVQPIPWNKIAERIPNRTGIQCQARWTEALDPCVRKGKWGVEEDQLLRLGVANFGRCWIRIAETIPGRTQRQCRTRWMQIKYKEDRQQKGSSHNSNATLIPPDGAADNVKHEPPTTKQQRRHSSAAHPQITTQQIQTHDLGGMAVDDAASFLSYISSEDEDEQFLTNI